MVKIEAKSLEDAYLQAAQQLSCSVTELDVVVIQQPRKKILGLLGKNAIIVANCKMKVDVSHQKPKTVENVIVEEITIASVETPKTDAIEKETLAVSEKEVDTERPALSREHTDKEEDTTANGLSIKKILPEFLAKKEPNEKVDDHKSGVVGKLGQVIDSFFEDKQTDEEIAVRVKKEINALFDQLCFSLNAVDVSVYNETTLLVEFSGEDAALLIGKEGYRYKALSYMLFNWINSQYKMQLRLEIAEFLKNQEESVARYLTGVYEEIDREGHTQTKVLDGVLVQIALKLLRERYHDKYVAIRSTRDGGKYIIINDYNSY
ncbi:MAG: protein jag [Epsilonproteobacteria bacterium]|nr:MAG: protein jag [Campylobacterota bacterium]